MRNSSHVGRRRAERLLWVSCHWKQWHRMTRIRSFQLNLLTVLFFTIVYPCEEGTIITPILQMKEREVQKAIRLCTPVKLVSSPPRTWPQAVYSRVQSLGRSSGLLYFKGLLCWGDYGGQQGDAPGTGWASHPRLPRGGWHAPCSREGTGESGEPTAAQPLLPQTSRTPQRMTWQVVQGHCCTLSFSLILQFPLPVLP